MISLSVELVLLYGHHVNKKKAPFISRLHDVSVYRVCPLCVYHRKYYDGGIYLNNRQLSVIFTFIHIDKIRTKESSL